MALLCLFIGSGVLGDSPARAQERHATEYQTRAAFLVNFARFIEWPAEAYPDPHAPLVIGILGVDPIQGALAEMVNGKAIGSHPIVVRHFQRDQVLWSCHLLYISRSEQKHMIGILGALRGSHVVAVSELDRFLSAGGAIHLLLENNQIRFDINLEVASHAHVRVSAKLLALARGVVGAGSRN